MQVDLEPVAREEAEAFLKKAPRSFFSQSPRNLAAMEAEGIHGELLGLRRDGVLLGLGKVLYLRFKKIFYSAEMSFAPIFLEPDAALFRSYLEALLSHVRANPRVLRLRLTPFIENARYDDLAKIADCPEAAEAANILQQMGFREIPGDFYEQIGTQARYLYVKPIEGMSYDEVLASFRYNIRYHMHRAARNGVKVRFLAPEEAELANSLLRESARRKGQKPWLVSYLSPTMMRELGDELMVPLAYLDESESFRDLDAETRQVEAELADLQSREPSRKLSHRIAEVEKQRDALAPRRENLEKLFAKYGRMIPLAVSQFSFSPSDCINAQSAVGDDFVDLSPVYAIHELMLRIAVERGCRYYNFFAVENPFTEETPDLAGLLDFKRAFRGRLESYMGTWEHTLRLGFLQ